MKREMVLDAIRHKEADYLPHNVELTSEELTSVAKHVGIDAGDFFEWAGNHVEKGSYNIGGRYERPGYFRDEFGVLWNRSGLDKDIGVVDEILIPEPDLSTYHFPEPNLDAVRRVTEQLLGNSRDALKLGKIGMTYYERAWSLVGMEDLLVDFLLEPDFVDALFDQILQYNLQIIDVALAYDIDGFYFGDDYGQQTGMIMSPEHWRRFIRPGLETMFARVKDAGKLVFLHSCGNISGVLGDLVDIGLDVYQTVQPEVYDLAELKRTYGRDLSFWGAISTQRLLPFASPTEVVEKATEIIGVMHEGGGYIAAPTHQVPADVPPENVEALVTLFKSYNR